LSLTTDSLDPQFQLANWFFVFARAGGLATVFPAFSAQTIPVRIRVGLSAALAFVLCPMLPAPPAASNSAWGFCAIIVTEVSVGLLLGFVCRMVFFAVDLAGGLISTEIGLMLSSNFNPLTSSALPVPGTILFWLAMMLLFTLNLHHWIIAGFQHTYVILPAGNGHMSEALSLAVIKRTGDVFRIGLQMSAPILAVSFVVTLLFSVLSRAVPQMNVFTESFPVRCLVGLIVFGLTCHLMAQHIENYLRRIPEDVIRITELLAVGN
jgi:flagellar biosynthesis protein FliR